ncbi:hypothetical protein FSP39_009084 [Pinctada imbricata]|uniref:Uncharacterized protein n=1 Tax=Pinctada imbricata TaxID=66713 RepID=A0AA89BWL6_PINIB|nr:hypothetical protein FSP39_009084 [Pinctada imbricata]
MNLHSHLRITLNLLVLVLWTCRRVSGQKGRAKAYWDRLKHTDDNSFSGIFHSGTRPEPSEQLPVIDLQESPDPALDPKPENLDYRTLRRLLGRFYDRNFMSVVTPIEHVVSPNGTLEFKMRKKRPKGIRPRFIKDFGKPVYTGDHTFVRLHVNRRTRKKVQKYLWNFTHCPVFHTWKDLGIRFWPRWIREGRCYQGRSCSIPPGMQCRPSSKTRKTLLRWHCRGPEPGSNCSWIRFQYPILTECSCSCPS